MNGNINDQSLRFNVKGSLSDDDKSKALSNHYDRAFGDLSFCDGRDKNQEDGDLCSKFDSSDLVDFYVYT